MLAASSRSRARSSSVEGVFTARAFLLRDARTPAPASLGAVKFLRGIARDEVADLLKTIAADAERSVTPLGLRPPEELRRWAHIRAFPLTYDQLELAHERQSEDVAGGHGEAGARAAQLWVGLARAAMVAESASQTTTGEVPSTDPVVVAKAIDEHRREVAYDQVIVGYLLQIAEELKRKGARSRLRLKAHLDHGQLAQSGHAPAVARHGRRPDQRKRFMLEAAQCWLWTP